MEWNLKLINIRKNSYIYQLTRIWFHLNVDDDYKAEKLVKVILGTSKHQMKLNEISRAI